MSAIDTVVNITTAVNNTSVGTLAWSNATNVTVSDDARATTPAGNPGDVSNRLWATKSANSGISPDAIINGIAAKIEGYSGALPNYPTLIAQLLVNDALVGAAKSQSFSTFITDVVFTFGSSSDLWSTTFLSNDINAANFGLAMYVIGNPMENNSRAIDHINFVITNTPGNMMMAM